MTLHERATLTGGVIPAHVPDAYPRLSCCGGPIELVPEDTYVVSDRDGNDFTLVTGQTYTIQTRDILMRGSFSKPRSAGDRLFFYGEDTGTWFRVRARDILDAYQP